ncbi:hypothetical protein Tco_0214734 [Tanacetum coccineum]
MSHKVPSTQISSPLIETATVIPDSSTIASTTAPPTISMISPLPQLTTPTHAPTTASTTTSIPTLPVFSSLFGFDQRVYATQTALESSTKEFKKKAQEERKLYIDVVEKSVKDIIKDEVKSLLPQILPKEVSDFATHVIQSTITESLENVVLAKSSSQSQSAYDAAASLTEFELKKIQLEKLEKSKLYRAAEDHRNLYDALIKSYQLDKDIFDSYVVSKVDRLEYAYAVYPILPAIPTQSKSYRRIDQGVGSTSGIRACALRNFDLGKMELENSQNNALAKLPMLYSLR